MSATEPKSHSLRKQLNRQYLLLSLFPLFTFFLCILIGGLVAGHHVADLINASIDQIGSNARSQLEDLGKNSIQSKAREVARHVESFLSHHAATDLSQLQNNEEFKALVMQPFGVSGYTCLYEAGTGIMRIHPNPKLIDRDMRSLAETLPNWWAIFEPSLTGVEVSGYYDWIEPNKDLRSKYMTMTPVAATVLGKTFMVAATTYTDEFFAPLDFIKDKQKEVSTEYRNFISAQGRLIGLAVAAIMCVTLVVVYLFSRNAARRLAEPIKHLSDDAKSVAEGRWDIDEASPVAERQDEIGELARSFNYMRMQLKNQFEYLKSNYKKLKATQGALKDSEEHYRSLFDNLPVGLYRSTPDGQTLDANPMLVKMFKYPGRDAFLLQRAEQLYVEPKDRDLFKKMVESQAGVYCSEFQMRCFDGAAIWVENQAKAHRDNEGRVLYYEGSLRDITERKLAEAALRESEENFRMLIEHAPVAIFCQVGGVFKYLNPAALKLFGADTPDHIVGRPVFDHIHPDFHASTLERKRILIEEKKPVPEMERVYLRVDGTPVTVEAKAVPFKFRGEDAVLSLARDATKRKLAQEALQLSEERFRTAFENASVGMCLVGLDGIFFEVNAALASMFGYAPAEMVGKSVSAFTHPDDLALRLQFVNGLTSGKLANGQQERRFLHRNGSIVWTLIWSNLQKDPKDRPLHFISLVQDITERKKAEEELQLARFCIDHAAVAIFRVADEGKIMDVNEHACRSLGYRRQELLGMTIFDIDPSFSPEIWVEHRRKLAAERVRVIQAQHRRKDGTCFPIEITANYFEQDGKGFTFSFATDISSRIDAEQDREKLEAQLRQAQKMEAIGTLAGGIAHDFNNILSVIIGTANLLEFSDGVAEADRSGLQQILTAADRARQLVKQILTFSRRGEQQRLLVNLKPVVKETFNFLKATLPSSIEVRQSIHADVGAILADPTQMQQVLMNLCTNAAHAMESQETGVLEIGMEKAWIPPEQARFEPDVEPGEFVKLTVADTGPGIESWVQERMFEPYFTTKRTGKGTGLGLSVVHGIVKAHGGFIKVYSEAGKGTHFHVFLPVAEGDGKTAALKDTRLPRGSETILVVDDEKALTDMTQLLLEHLGYRVETRTSPLEAIEAFRANPGKYHGVITDMTMPQMNGLNLSKKLLEIRADLPILLCTGFSDAANEEKARAVGIREFAFKPLALSDFAKTLRKMLDEAKTLTTAPGDQ